MPSQPLQAKARNDGLLWAVLVLLLIGTLVLRVEVFGRLNLDWQKVYFQQRAEKIASTHAKYWRQGGAIELVWCGPYVDEHGLHVPKLRRYGVLKSI